MLQSQPQEQDDEADLRSRVESLASKLLPENVASDEELCKLSPETIDLMRRLVNGFFGVGGNGALNTTFLIERIRRIAKVGDQVIYIPYHAKGNSKHQDCERGYISAFTDRYIFVKFIPDIAAVGWCEATARACDPRTIYVDVPKKPPIALNIQNDAANNSS